jgi:general secretion pathway protein G
MTGSKREQSRTLHSWRISSPLPGLSSGRLPGVGGTGHIKPVRPVHDQGFSLIEMLVVLAIMALLAALVAPRLFTQVDRSKQTVAETETKALESSLETMRLDLGRYPSESEGLSLLVEPPSDPVLRDKWFGPYLKDGLPTDPWGNPYGYAPPTRDARGYEQAPRVYSYGEDNKPGGEGTNQDIGRAIDVSSPGGG